MVQQIPQLTECSHAHYLSLFDYLSACPQRFFAVDAFTKYLAYLGGRDAHDRAWLEQYLRDNQTELNEALRCLSDVNRYAWHDALDSPDEHEMIRFLDDAVHPAYLRLVEAVFFRFVRLAACFSRVQRNAGTEGLDLYNAVRELSNSPFPEVAGPYRHTVRNAIAHGRITYLQMEVRYRDKKSEETLTHQEMRGLLDDLLDVCNALALALKVFLLTHMGGSYCVPQQILLHELQAQTEAPWWRIVGCLPSELPGAKQLVIFARPNTKDYWKLLYSALVSGILAEFFAPGYDRYFFSLRSPRGAAGWAALHGRALHEIRTAGGGDVEDYEAVFDSVPVLWGVDPRRRQILGTAATLIEAARIQWQITIADWRRDLRWPELTARISSIRRNAWGAVVNGSVVITSHGRPVDQATVRNSCGRIVGAVWRAARRQCGALAAVRYLPLGYARIGLFRRDHRRGKLSNYGLGPDLICTIQVKRIRRIRAPDIFDAEVETRGKYRIAWNRAWLDQQKPGTEEPSANEE